MFKKNKNYILIIGNGFDIGLHLPTKYTDFMTHLLMYRCNLKKLPMPRDKNNNELYKMFEKKMNNWRNKYHSNINTFDNTIFKNILILILIFKYNYMELFRLCGHLEDLEESFLKITLYPECVEKVDFNEKEIGGSDIHWFNVEEILLEISNSETYVKIIDEINNKSQNSSILSQNQIEISKTINDDDLKNGLIFIKSSLSIYLQCVQDIYLTPSNNQTRNYFQDICNTLEFRKCKNIKKYTQIISLNYTNSAEKLFGNIKTEYPHGKIKSECPEESKIVLGCYNCTDENNFDTSFIDFQKYYQRILLGTGNYETIGSKELYIDFYGFSCDPADTELINSLLQDLDKVRQIRIFCYKDSSQIIINLIKSIGREVVLKLTKKNILEFKIISETT